MRNFRIAIVFIVAFIVCGVCVAPWFGNWDEQIPGKGQAAQQTLRAFQYAEQQVFGTSSVTAFENGDIQPPASNEPTLWPKIFAPITHTFGVTIAINLAAWLGVFLTFFCAYLFCWEISGDFWPGIIGGFAFGTGSFVISQVGGGSVAAGSAFLIPLAGFFLVRALDKGGTVYGLLSLLTLLGCCFYHLAFGVGMILFALISSFYALLDEGLRPMLRGLGITAAAIALYIPMLSSAEAAASVTSLDLLEPFYFSRPYGNIFPYIPLVLAIGATFIIKGKRIFWWGISVLFFLLSLGPTLQILGKNTAIPGLWRVFSSLPGLWTINDPDRLIVFAHLALCALVAMGLRAVLDWLEEKGKDESLLTRGLFTLLIVAAVLLSPGYTTMV